MPIRYGKTFLKKAMKPFLTKDAKEETLKRFNAAYIGRVLAQSQGTISPRPPKSAAWNGRPFSRLSGDTAFTPVFIGRNERGIRGVAIRPFLKY